MNPILLLVTFGGLAVKVWRDESRKEYKSLLTDSFKKLLTDDSQHVILNRQVDIPSTVAYLVEMRLRANPDEISNFAQVLSKKGYSRTSTALHECVKKLDRK